MHPVESAGFWSTFHRAIVRPVVSLALVVAATLVLAPTLLVNWTRTQIYDRDAFAESAVVTLRNEAVRDALVQEIVDEIVSVGSPDAAAIRPLIEFVTATVVDSVAFREIFRDSVKQLHQETLDDGAERSDPVALTVVDALIVVTAYVQQAYPEVASQLPPNLGDAFIKVRTRDWAVKTVAYGRNVTELAIILPAVLFVLYGSALLLSNNRRQTLVLAGVGCVIVAILLIVGQDLARDAVLGSGFGDKAASEAIWDVYTRSLAGWAALCGGFGLVLAVAATAVHRANPSRQLEVVLRAISYSPEAAWTRVARAAGFILLGLLIVAQRDEVLQLVVLALAAYAVYYGLSELIWLATGGIPAFAGRPGLETRRALASTSQFAMKAGSVTMLAVAAAGGIFYAYAALQAAGGEVIAPPHVTACNGHSQLCDRRLNELVFLGSHNSMSAATQTGWYFPHQLRGIRPQLDAGVRLLLLDTYNGYDTGNGVRTAGRDIVAEALPPDDFSEQVIEAARRLAGVIGGVEAGDPKGTYLCHAYCELGATPLTPALSEINDFLDANPGEVIILFMQDTITPADTAKAFIASGLVNHVHTLRPDEPLPTLRELIERDERVLVFSDSGAPGVDWYMPAHEFVQDTPFRVDTPEEFSCAFGRGEPDNGLFALDHWLSQSFPSTATARQINSFDVLYSRVAQCHRERERKVNFIIVNFVEIGDAGAVVDYLNGVGPRTHAGE